MLDEKGCTKRWGKGQWGKYAQNMFYMYMNMYRMKLLFM